MLHRNGNCALFFAVLHDFVYTKRPAYAIRKKEEHLAFRDVLFKKFNAQPVSFSTQDGIGIAGLLIIRPEAARNILVCHGYRMAKERMHRFALMFPHDNILLFDYRAHGQSEGGRSSIGYYEKNDVLAALHFLQENTLTAHLPIVGVGVSMGAVTLLSAACQSGICKAIVLDAPFARLDSRCIG